jgi:hypothetical protein
MKWSVFIPRSGFVAASADSESLSITTTCADARPNFRRRRSDASEIAVSRERYAALRREPAFCKLERREKSNFRVPDNTFPIQPMCL